MDTHRYSGPAAKAAPAASPVSEPAEINAPDVHFAATCSIWLPWILGQCDPRGAEGTEGGPLCAPSRYRVPPVLQGKALPFPPSSYSCIQPGSHLTAVSLGVCQDRRYEQDLRLLTQAVLSLLLCRQNRWARKPQTVPEQILYWLAQPPACIHFN